MEGRRGCGYRGGMTFSTRHLGLLLFLAPLPVAAQGLDVLHPQGPFTEPMTGMLFPEAVNDFQRVNVIKYKPDGSDESGGYNRIIPDAEINATVYVFPSLSLISIGSPQYVIDDARSRLCESQFHGVEREVMVAHPDAQRLSEEQVMLEQQGQIYRGFRASYKLLNPKFFGRSQVSQSDAYLFCFVGGKWTVEYRFDYPLGYDAGPPIAAFMRDLKWTLGNRI